MHALAFTASCLIWAGCIGPLLLAACRAAPRKNPFDPELTPPVELTVVLDDTAGTATLTWTPYAGEAAFAEYRVLRNPTESTRLETLEVIDRYCDRGAPKTKTPEP